MPCQPGEKLGPYEILELIGKGGMGEVYRARDPRLNRDVAIKLSAAQFSERFEREAKAVAALNHPNICHLYDVGSNYLVMEYIEGDAPKGPLPLEEVMRIMRQIADALEAAHDKGITHRDLKPGNIKVKPDGTVKVLDFGLAKIEPVAGASQSENSPTLSMAATQMGVILGTAGYMSPEQARGKAVDKRADIWAFGVVFYELLMGKQLFQGEDVSHTMAAVIMQEPNLEAVPAQVRKMLQRCLEKDPKKRLRDISGVELLLESGTASPAQAASLPHTAKLPWIAAAALVVALGVSLWAPWRAPAPAPRLERFEIAPPDKDFFDNSLGLSPDGRHLMFVAGGSGAERSIWVRSLDTLQARKIAPASSNPVPFWSADSRSIAFQQDGKLKKVDIGGGPPVTLSDAPQQFGGGAWNEDNVIVFGNRAGGLMQVPSAGGVPVQLTKLDDKRGDNSHGFPSFLPDRKHFIYLRRSSKAEFAGIYIGTIGVPPDRQDSRLLVATASSAVYTPSPDPRDGTRGLGFLLFLREATLMAQPFDAKALELKGEPVPIAEQVSTTSYAYGRFSASWNGNLAFAAGGSTTSPSRLTWLDRQGKSLGTIGQEGRYGTVAISPDGSRVAAEKFDAAGSADLWLIDSAPGGKSDRFTFDPARETSAVWSPDGSQIVFASNAGGTVLNLFKKPSNLAGKEEELFKSAETKVATDWSRDGKTLAFDPFGLSGGDSDVWTLNLSDKKAELFFKTQVRESGGRFSPDGRFLAYASQVTGRNEVYVRPFPANEAGGQQMVSLGGGSSPLWKRDGKELYYRSLDGKVMAVSVTAGAALKFGQPKALFPYGLLANADSPAYFWDATADGSKFLLNLRGDETVTTSNPHTLVVNWTAGLK